MSGEFEHDNGERARALLSEFSAGDTIEKEPGNVKRRP